ncbi:hypothetical protein LP420_30380 [Massilia sp. B-10]|nr:hypothetical protein LP420_30380 [Massilia sp. B-10]
MYIRPKELRGAQALRGPGERHPQPALLRSAFPTRMGRHDSMALYVVERATCDASKIGAQPVFYIGEHTRPAELDVKPVAMAADQPILMQYYATLSARSRFCKIFVKAQFEPGKHYAAYGGSDIHILSFKQDTCSFTIVDEETKIPLPMEQVPLSCQR